MAQPSIYEIIKFNCAARPNAKAFLGVNLDINYRQFKADIEQTCHLLLSLGLQAGAKVTLQFRANYQHTVFAVALDRLGMASFSYQFQAQGMVQEDWWKKLEFDCVFSEEDKPEGTDSQWMKINANVSPQRFQISTPLESIISDQDPSRITRYIRSSGTTGTPKIVAFTRELILNRVTAQQFYLEGRGTNRHLLGMPPGTIGGYTMMLSVICRGATTIICHKAENYVKIIDAFKVSHLLLMPNTLQGITTKLHTQGRTLSTVKNVITGGTPFPAQLKDKAIAVFGPSIWNSYASTEAGTVARGNISLLSISPNLVGVPLPGTIIEIVDEEDNLLAAGETGIVRIKSENTADGYQNLPEGNKTFRNGYVYPGDLGSIDDNGYFSVAGRTDNVINLRGVKTTAEKFEQELTMMPEVKEAAIFQANTPTGLNIIGALVLEEGDASAFIAAIKQRLGARSPHALIIVKDLPRNTMGKIMRSELTASFEATVNKTEA